MILLFRLVGAEAAMSLDVKWHRDEDGRIGSQKPGTGKHHWENLTVYVQSTSLPPWTKVFDSRSDEGTRMRKLQYRCSMYGLHQRSLHLPAPDP